MAFTISVNLASIETIYDLAASNKTSLETRSVGVKTLADVLGDSVDGQGYVKTSGSTMSGYLTLAGESPDDKINLSNKSYVDSHSPLRKYFYQAKETPSLAGDVKTGTFILSGADRHGNHLFFFEREDDSLDNIVAYLDVYRDGVLQQIGSDYRIINNFGGSGLPGVTAIKFFEPFIVGTDLQVNMGNAGAFPSTFGVRTLNNSMGTRFFKVDGYTQQKNLSSFLVSYLDVRDFAATSSQVRASTANDAYVSPATLSAFPLMPRASGLFRKNVEFIIDNEYPPSIYGSANGNFTPMTTYKILSVISKADGIDPQYFRAIFQDDVVDDVNYNCTVTVRNSSFDPDLAVFNNISSEFKTTSSFDFYVFDIFGTPPVDVYEISIMVF
jgi:hypothetical protein